jgi:predicted outer membrane lipoprotein
MSESSPTSEQAPPAENRGAGRLYWLGPMLLACCFGIVNCFWPTLHSGFARMQADPIDTRFNHYILEHLWRCLHGGYVGTFWSPPFFYPTEHVLAYSDNLIGSAPIYWLFRLIFEPTTAFSLWMIGCCVLCFAAFAALALRLKLHPWLAATGAMLFAFGFHRAQLLNHQQLLPHFFLPLAVWAAWEFVIGPTVAKLAALATCVFMQILCGIYLGWFLCLSLAILVPMLLLIDRTRLKELWIFTKKRGWLGGLILLVFAGITALTFWPYHQQQIKTGGYTWETIQKYLPPPAAFIPPWRSEQSRDGIVDGSPLVAPEIPLLGFVFFATLVALSPILIIRARRRDPACALGAASIITGIAMMLLSVSWPNHQSAWWVVYRFIPGAHAIRTVSRIDLTVFFFLTLAIVIGLEQLLHRFSSATNRNMLAIGMAILLCSEQWVKDLPSFDTRPWDQETSELRDLISSGGEVGYVAFYTPTDPLHFFSMQVSAMWAGLDANKPVVNGYSGWNPPNYPLAAMGPKEMSAWLSHQSKKPATLTVITPMKPGLPREWSLQMQQQSMWATDDFIAGTYKVP